MGDYTELLFKAVVRPTSELDFIFDLLGRNKGLALPAALPDHPLFRLPRCRLLFIGGSACHVTTILQMRQSPWEPGWILSINSSFKNYDGEVEAFFDWIAPHMIEQGSELLGWVMHPYAHELDVGPDLLYMREGKIVRAPTSLPNCEEKT